MFFPSLPIGPFQTFFPTMSVCLKPFLSWICCDSSNSNTSGENHLCLQASHCRRVWDCSHKTLSLASQPARNQGVLCKDHPRCFISLQWCVFLKFIFTSCHRTSSHQVLALHLCGYAHPYVSLCMNNIIFFYRRFSALTMFPSQFSHRPKAIFWNFVKKTLLMLLQKQACYLPSS